MKCRIIFSRTNKKNIILSSAEFVHSIGIKGDSFGDDINHTNILFVVSAF